MPQASSTTFSLEGAAPTVRVAILLGHAGESGTSYGVTGVERVVQRLLEGCAPKGIEPYLVYPKQGRLGEVYATHCRALLQSEPTRRFDRDFLRQLTLFLQKHTIDVVLSIGLRQDFHAALVCRKLNLPHVVRRPVALADETMPWLRRVFYGVMDTWTLHQCSEIVACSRTSAQRMQQTQALPKSKIVVVVNGVEFPEVPASVRRASRAELDIASDVLMVVGVGQLIHRKSFHRLIDSIAEVASHTERKVECVLLGEGPERARLQESASRQGVVLRMPGYVNHPENIVAAADISVLPSLAEGMPFAVLEAMALGIPTIATRVAGTPEVIEDEVSGLLIPPGDTPALTAALARLVEDDALRSNLGAAGEGRIRKDFSLRAMVDGLSAILRRNSRQFHSPNGKGPA